MMYFYQLFFFLLLLSNVYPGENKATSKVGKKASCHSRSKFLVVLSNKYIFHFSKEEICLIEKSVY